MQLYKHNSHIYTQSLIHTKQHGENVNETSQLNASWAWDWFLAMPDEYIYIYMNRWKEMQTRTMNISHIEHEVLFVNFEYSFFCLFLSFSPSRFIVVVFLLVSKGMMSACPISYRRTHTSREKECHVCALYKQVNQYSDSQSTQCGCKIAIQQLWLLNNSGNSTTTITITTTTLTDSYSNTKRIVCGICNNRTE